MTVLEIEGRRVEVGEEFLRLSPEEQNAAVDEIAASLGVKPGAASPPADPQQAAAQPQQAEPRGVVQRFGEAAAGIYNDISAGFQGVNPVAMQEQQGKAVGALRDMGGGAQMVDVDGTLEPMENYPADRFVTRLEPSNGITYIYPRTADVEEGRLASAGRLSGYGVVSQIGGAVRATQTPKPNPSADAAALGITPSFAMRGNANARIASGGEQLATTSGRFKADAERVTGEIAGAATRIADAAGPGGSRVEAGDALKRGAETFVTAVKGKEGTLWGTVDKAIPKKTPIAAPETTAFLRAEIEALEGVPNISATLGNGRIAGWLADLEGGNLTWQAARRLRTDIGEAIGQIKGPLADVAGGRLKAIYGTLSTDLESAVSQAGPEAATAWVRANAFTRASRQRIDGALGKILTADSPEKAFSGFMAMAQKGTAKSNIDQLGKVYRSIPKDEQAVVSGSIIRLLGEASPGAQDAAGEVFSAASFLTNWNKLSPDARTIVAKNGMDAGVPQQLEQLARVIESAKGAGATRNFSNTAGAINASAMTAGLLAAPVSTTGFAALTHLSARAVTNQTFLRAINQFYATGKPDMLKKIAAGNTPLAVEAATTLRLESQTSPQLPSPAAAPVASLSSP